MNNWKIAFWICFFVLLAISGVSALFILNQQVAISDAQDKFMHAEYDKQEMMFIVNHQNFLKEQIMAHMLRFENYGDQDKGDTLELKTINLIFKDGKLEKVIDK